LWKKSNEEELGIQSRKPRIEDARLSGALAEAERIALVRLSALGDVINTLPALTALRRARPDAHIAWVCERASASLLEGHPLLDAVIAVDRKGWEGSVRRLRGVSRVAGEMRQFFGALREGAFDATIDFQGNLRSGIVAFLTRAPLRIGLGRKEGKELSHLFSNRRIELPEGTMHRVERALFLLQALGIETSDAAPVVPVTDADRQRVDEFLSASGLGDAPFAAIHPGTSAFGRYKQWPGDRWAEVASRLGGELALRVVLTRGPAKAEAQEAEAIRGGAKNAIVAPVLSLRELGELFRRCRLFLSPDTGPMHLASAVGAPVVALFGPKDPRIYGPYFGPRAIVEKPLECRPCRRRSCDDPRCMLAITPEDVMRATERLTRGA